MKVLWITALFPLFSFLLSPSLHADSAPVPSPLYGRLVNLVEKLRQKPMLKMKVDKKLTSPFMLEPRLYEGTLYVSRGKLRLELEKPAFSLMVLTGEDLWFEEPKVGEKGIKVTHYKIKGRLQGNALLGLLFGESGLWKDFELTSEKDLDSGNHLFAFKPRKAERMEINSLEIQTTKEALQLKSLKYVDDRENETEFIFKTIEPSESTKPELFQYKVPPGADLTHF